MTASRRFPLAVVAIAALGLVLRLKGIHDPIFDHPGWRQGDTAAIARNFATLNFNPLFPQTDYDGPPPNYVELELQIVPWLAACLYKLVGVHEVFGRLLSAGFGTATIAVVALFGRWLFGSSIAGLAAAAIYAILPGAWYYGRTFMPDTAMVFFLTAALYACGRWIVERGASWRGLPGPLALLTLAFLAKPVAVTAAIPVAACAFGRFGPRETLRRGPLWVLGIVAFGVLAAYDAVVSSHAEWHWASGITKLHVIPSLRAALTNGHAFAAKAAAFGHAFRMLWQTMLGPLGFLVALAGFCVPLRSRANALVWGWLAGALLYAYVVVTVERVDYYLYLALPLCALAGGRFAAWCVERWGALGDAGDAPRRQTLAGLGALLWLAMLVTGYRQIAPYWDWSRANYARAKRLDATLDRGVLVVMGHYDPSILYTINRKGWEEDPHLWTPFDEQSAIRKGARYFIAVEKQRLKSSNLELYCWLARFPVRDADGAWPVYETDPAKVLPGAEERWRAFRDREKAGTYANWSQVWRTAPDPCG